jgi:uncharacterized protein (DUF362 family)
VSIARCKAYDREAVFNQLQTMMDQLGGLAKLVAGKTVVVKVNLTGGLAPALGLPASRTYHVHPDVVLATATLLDRAGARRIRFVECTYQNDSFEAFLHKAGWDLNALAALKATVDYEDTHNLGKGKQYYEVKVPWGGSLFPAYHLNHSYVVDCDVYLSLAKLKNHATAGVTLGIKNNFGITPTSLYSHHETNERSTSARIAVFHTGAERPADGLPQEVAPKSPRRPTYRVPRHTVDSVGIRPIDLTVIDGIETVSGGEGPWLRELAVQKPGLLLAGRNPVCTDAVATAVMGYDPMGAAATGPYPGDNHLAMAASFGLGTNDPKEIEVLGLSIKEALHPFGWEPRERNG